MEFSSHTIVVNNAMLGNLGSSSHQAKVETAGLKLWKMHLAWTSGIWSKVIEHLDMWGWDLHQSCLITYVCCLTGTPSSSCLPRMKTVSVQMFFSFLFSPLLKAKQLLMWFHFICCTLKSINKLTEQNASWCLYFGSTRWQLQHPLSPRLLWWSWGDASPMKV